MGYVIFLLFPNSSKFIMSYWVKIPYKNSKIKNNYKNSIH
jgi:hypothetical protein